MSVLGLHNASYTKTEITDVLVGQELAVLAESDGTGHSGNFARVAVPGAAPGTVATVTPRAVVDGLLQ